MKDVALLSGVSQVTVSRVVNGAANVSAATPPQVVRTMEQLDYHRTRLREPWPPTAPTTSELSELRRHYSDRHQTCWPSSERLMLPVIV